MFPQSNLNYVIEKLLKKSKTFPSLQDYVIYLIKELDPNNDGLISFEEFSNSIKK
jgi:Ca2+-binding EF-hand superfamily protein